MLFPCTSIRDIRTIQPATPLTYMILSWLCFHISFGLIETIASSQNRSFSEHCGFDIFYAFIYTCIFHWISALLYTCILYTETTNLKACSFIITYCINLLMSIFFSVIYSKIPDTVTCQNTEEYMWKLVNIENIMLYVYLGLFIAGLCVYTVYNIIRNWNNHHYDNVNLTQHILTR
jgi:hypothetical protein